MIRLSFHERQPVVTFFGVNHVDVEVLGTTINLKPGTGRKIETHDRAAIETQNRPAGQGLKVVDRE